MDVSVIVNVSGIAVSAGSVAVKLKGLDEERLLIGLEVGDEHGFKVCAGLLVDCCAGLVDDAGCVLILGVDRKNVISEIVAGNGYGKVKFGLRSFDAGICSRYDVIDGEGSVVDAEDGFLDIVESILVCAGRACDNEDLSADNTYCVAVVAECVGVKVVRRTSVGNGADDDLDVLTLNGVKLEFNV